MWRQLSHQSRAMDLTLQKAQQNYCAALVPTLQSMELIRIGNDSKLKELVGDIFKILSNAVTATSSLRQEKIKKELHPMYHAVCKNVPSATQLFGDTLDEDFKSFKQTTQPITKQRFLAKRPGFPARTPAARSQYMSANNKGKQKRGRPHFRAQNRNNNNNRYVHNRKTGIHKNTCKSCHTP
ncbi:hypothetical protein DPMN_134396 [Dreissena polymorpha]|uniref:Uncharacterized protein n=1 Tax=Dreissena polymorpha TaxID=45954 RepID=A0A9D4FX49_DREPO|nr:hypothetical protein DPMN_134396 [Dreissena polymorpha]